MIGLIPQLNTAPPEPNEPKTSYSDDLLGSTLQKKWERWSTIRRQIEERWLEDLRMFNQENEPDAQQLSKFHNHIYIGTARKNCLSAYARVYDVIKDKHWEIEHTPVPEGEAEDPSNQQFMDMMAERAERMSTEIEDQLLDLHYDDNLQTAVLEGCILGTGVIKGVIPTVKKEEKWAFVPTEAGSSEWDVATTETPWMSLTSPSVFNVYPDPYALSQRDSSGVFERHVLNRQQFGELKDDPRFDAKKIDEILTQTEDGNHIPLWHETQRRNIAKITDTTAAQAGRYDLLEYWGQVSGHMLSINGVENVEDSETYYANVWVCSGKTLLAKIMPMKKKRIPYHFFHYAKVPHQFWGVGPARMGRSTQLMENGVYRAMLDGLAMAAVPMSEVNVNMLKDGQDPAVMKPGQIYLRDSGDPSTPAVRFFQPDVPTGNLLQVGETVRTLNQEETSLPAYSYGAESQSINDSTAQGTAMRLNMASLPTKVVLKNLEDGIIRPVIESIYDWNMEWSDREDIKGDMHVNVLGSNSIMMKEQRSQQLLQFLNLTANPIDVQRVDRNYLLRELSKTLEIDPDKSVPEVMPDNALPPQQPNPVEEAQAQLALAQAEKVKAETVKVKGDTLFTLVQDAGQVAQQPGLVPIADSLGQSIGFQDANGYPVAQAPQQFAPAPMPHNTHPNFPANPDTPQEESIEQQQPMMPGSPAVGAARGIETPSHEGMR